MQKKIETIKEMLALSKAGSDEQRALKAAYRAMKRHEPRPPIYETADPDEPIILLCPACDNEIESKYAPDYCPACGQALEWYKYFDRELTQ